MSRDAPLKEAWEIYAKAVDEYAEKQFNEAIKPFCKKRGYVFLAGNGTWWIGPPGNLHSMDEREAREDPEFYEILKCLWGYPQGFSGNDLGSLMPSFEPEEKC